MSELTYLFKVRCLMRNHFRLSVNLVSEADNFKFKTRYERALKQFPFRLPVKYFGTMKKSLHEKFKNKINFVKPLYRRGRTERIFNKITPLDYDRTLKLRGDDFDVKTILNAANVINVKSKVSKEYSVTLPGACESERVFRDNKDRNHSNASQGIHKYTTVRDSQFRVNDGIADTQKYCLMEDKATSNLDGPRSGPKIVIHKAPETWLRVYPAPKIAGETMCSVIVRCVFCQLGLTSFLILWTIIGVFVIQTFEGPQEMKISREFEKEQNQLVIDLATELRQITPLSPKWKNAIERRIEDERQLTIAAVGHGARLRPGQFWNLSGTFLFAVYVMTALGFGAPVPHTVWGRTCALIYAILAVPTHIYLMVNTSTCVVVNVEAYVESLKTTLQRKLQLDMSKSEFRNTKGSPNRSRYSKTPKPSNKTIHKNITTCLGKCSVAGGLPLLILLYYLLGVVTFGILRNKDITETILFPLEFTTTGGLEHVESYIRVLYGMYIEGAMCILACTLAAVRRYGSNTIRELAEHYRLLVTEKCVNCQNNL